MAGKLRTLGIHTVYDLLTYIPFRYNDYSLVSPIARVQPGETVTIVGTLISIKTFITKHGKRLVTATISDDTGKIDIVWFNQQYLIKVLKAGDTLSVSGRVDWFGPKIVFSSPTYEVLHEEANGRGSLHTGRLVPVYSETAGLSSKWLRGRIDYVLEHCLPLVTDRLPHEIVEKEHLLDVKEAIQTVHFPESMDSVERARERLAFEELFMLLVRSYEQKRIWQTTLKAHPLELTVSALATFGKTLPFVLTGDQQSSIQEILSDLAKPIPMNRLLEGDVGSGKTVVAASAMYTAYTNGFSSILMAPTQILAQQHFDTLQKILAPHNIIVELILGGKKKKKTVKSKMPRLLVGTHALLTMDTLPTRIGLIVIDEQQRFGVNQRAQLRALSHSVFTPHQLTMTATPIPRTLAQTVFGNLDISTLKTLPSGRKPVKTWVVPKIKRTAAYTWIDKELTHMQSQAFIVCPFIDESESMSTVKAASAEFTHIKQVFPDRSVGLLHGRMKSDEKTAILEAFRNKTYDILVSTPVVEVGIDIPNATIMVIEAAERFGLSQLHQLRGRVGRSDKASYCLLFTELEEPQVLTRLKALETVYNGPELAELDLTLRGPGELFGTQQHGVPGLTLARLTDTDMVKRAQKALHTLTAKDPELNAFAHLREFLNESKIETIKD
jgi:ATP-dependent DNA helicase RecG